MKKIFASAVFCLVFQISVRSQAAFFDPSFGSGGIVETDFGYSEIYFGTDMIIQPDGKLLVRLNQSAHHVPSKKRLVKLARFLPDGAVDSTFGSGGTIVLLDTINWAGAWGERQLALLPDGKILTALSMTFQTEVKTWVYKFDSAGQPDPSFGSGGRVEITDSYDPFSSPTFTAHVIFPLPNGKILLCNNAFDVGLRVINANGSLANGSPVNWTWTDPEEEIIHQWKLTPDKKHVVACGRVINHDAPGSTYDVFFGKFDQNGWAGGSFGDFGLLRHDLSGGYDIASDFQFLPDGKILYIGNAKSNQFFVGRLLANGKPDSSFHSVGHRIFPNIFSGGLSIGSAFFSPLAADQTFIAGINGGSVQQGLLVRMKADGTVDSTFNAGEPVYFPNDFYSPQRAFILPDRRILVCGSRWLGTPNMYRFFIARLLPEADAVQWFADADGDGFGSAASGVQFSVGQPAGFVASSNDCDDANAQIFPSATEICNGTDDNCDGKTDEIPAIACQPTLVLNLGDDGKAKLAVNQVLMADPNQPCWDANAKFELDKTEFDCSKIGQQTVRLTATSTLGGTNECQTSVQILDKLPPVALCQSEIEFILDDTGLFTLSADSVNAGSFDNCQIAEITVSPSQFSTANLGSNIVTMTVRDASGNVSTCSAVLQLSELIGTAAPDFLKSSMQILPNPAREKLFLKILENVEFKNLRLEIVEASGRILISKNENSSERLIEIDLQNLPVGHHFLRVILDGLGVVVFDFDKI